MSGDSAAAARVRARLLSRLNHELRAPLARIVALAGGGADADQTLRAIDTIAHQQLAWLAQLQECARYELQAPELALAPAYLHSLLQQTRHAAHELPALAMLDARMLAQVLELLGRQGQPVQLGVAGAGMLALRFSTGTGDGPWRDVAGSLEDEKALPELLLAMHLVRAMGGRLQQSPDGLRFEISVALASEADAMPPAPRFVLPPAFGQGRSVLLLEPHAPMRDYLAEILESAAFDVHYTPGARSPALVLCSDENVWDILRSAYGDAGGGGGAGGAGGAASCAPPVLLHAMLPPAQAERFAAVLYKPATPEALLKALRGALRPVLVRR